MVDVIGAETGADQLLEQVGFLVAALGRAEASQRVLAFLGNNLLEAIGGEIERLFPARFPEGGEWIGRIDRVVGRLGGVGPADQRLGQPVLVARIVEAVAAFDAQAAMVGRTVATDDLDDVVVLDVVG